MRRCVFALGSNLGDRLAMLESACDYLADVFGGLRLSQVYETEPVGCPAGSPSYLNACVEVENKLRSLYLTQQIYSDPIVMANVGPKGEAAVDARYVQVTGYVAGKKNLPYREGMTLIQALIECGDITDFGSRKIQITRGKVTRTYDYFSARDRSIKLMPNDSVFVPRRPAFEGRPDKIGP